MAWPRRVKKVIRRQNLNLGDERPALNAVRRNRNCARLVENRANVPETNAQWPDFMAVRQYTARPARPLASRRTDHQARGSRRLAVIEIQQPTQAFNLHDLACLVLLAEARIREGDPIFQALMVAFVLMMRNVIF